MKPRRTFTTSALIGFLVVLPFIVLELINRRFDGNFPFPLFVVMWLLSFAFVLLVRPLARPGRLHVALRVAGLILIGWVWTGLVIDQMPCFLGVPNCD